MHPTEAIVLSSVKLTADSVQLKDDKPTSTIQIAKVGDFKSTRYNKFKITEEHVDMMVKNHAASTTEPPIDYHHLSDDPVLPDQAIAAGWVKSLEKRADKSLWGSVEWTPKAAKHIQDGELRYISPVILWDALDEQGASIGTKLKAAALTNYPFLKGMASVSLSELQAQGILLADLSIDQKRARLSEALQTYYKDSATYCWLRDVFDDYVVYEHGTKIYRLDYTTDSKLNVSFSGEPQEVVPQYVALSAHGGKKTMADENKNTNQLPPEVVKLQADFAEMQTKFADTAGKVVSLTAALETEKTENQKLRDQIKKSGAEASVEKLLRAGKIVPAQKEDMVALAMKDEEFFTKMIANMPVVVKLNDPHGTNDGDEAAAMFNAEGGDPIKLYDDKVNEYKAANPKASQSEAMEAVEKANPGLYEKRRMAYAATTAVRSSSVQ